MAKFSATFAVIFCILFNMVMSKASKASGADENTAIYNTPSLMTTNVGVITRKQAAIWIPIMFAIISVAAVYALFAIDDKKNRDTILYAKFLANLKDR